MRLLLLHLQETLTKWEDGGEACTTLMDQTDATPAAVSSPPSRQRSLLGMLIHWGRDLVFSVVLAVLVILFLYQPVKVEGTSMMPYPG